MDYKDGYVILDKCWECTDPDNFQFCKRLSDTEFSYCQLANESLIDEINLMQSTGHFFDVRDFLSNKGTKTEDWYCGDIDVTDYDSDEIGEVLSAYDGVLDGCEDNPELRNQLIAECIFESFMFTDFSPYR